MTELKEAPKPQFPGKNAKHPEAEIKILEINNADGQSMIGTKTDFRRFAVKGGKRSTFKIELKKQASIVTITVEPEPGSKVAKKYYGETPAWSFTDSFEPGQHTIEWDGRGDIDGRRLLIEGDYKVTAWCACICGNEYIDVKTIKVMKPYADAYGSVYPPSYHQPVNLTPPATYVRGALPSLSDGSGFECAGSVLATAKAALQRMCDYSAVWYWCGHARPGLVVLFDKPLDIKKTRIVSEVAVSPDLATSMLAPVDTLADGALDHVFLAFLLGCETAKAPSLPSALLSKGVDLVVSFPEKVWLHQYLPFTRTFFEALDAGEGVRMAAFLAQMKLPAADRLVFNHSVSAGGGAGGRDKLLPARNGRWKR